MWLLVSPYNEETVDGLVWCFFRFTFSILTKMRKKKKNEKKPYINFLASQVSTRPSIPEVVKTVPLWSNFKLLI